MPRPARRTVRSATTLTDRSSRSLRRYDDGGEGDDEDDRPRRRLPSKSRSRSRPSSHSTSPRSSQHSESIVLETPPKPAPRYRLPARSGGNSRSLPRTRSKSRSRSRSRSTSRSSSPDSGISVSTQDERRNRRAGKKPARASDESEPEPVERRFPVRRRRKGKAILADDSDQDGIYEEPSPIAAKNSQSPTRPRQRLPADSQSSSRKPDHRERRDSGKYVSPIAPTVQRYVFTTRSG